MKKKKKKKNANKRSKNMPDLDNQKRINKKLLL